ncbi:hypothetical protein CHUAL_012171 [Chamberlinius hualienensis]
MLVSASFVRNKENDDLSVIADGRDIKLFDAKNDGSWLQMILIFSNNKPNGTNEIVPLAPPSSIVVQSSKNVTDQLSIRANVKPNTTKPLINVTTEEPFNVTASFRRTCQPRFIQMLDHCFFFDKRKTNWKYASKRCNLKNADLVRPLSQSENYMITRFLARKFKDVKNWWIGRTDDGNRKRKGSNTLKQNENNRSQNENCSYYAREFKYAVKLSKCDNKFGYICQQRDTITKVTVNTPSTKSVKTSSESMVIEWSK